MRPRWAFPRSLILVATALVVAAASAPTGGTAGRGATDGVRYGDDGNAYTSPRYGYRIAWDPAVWEPIAHPAATDGDGVLLGHDDRRITVDLRGYDDGAGNHVACLREAATRIERRGWVLRPLALPPPATGATASGSLLEGEPILPASRLDAFYLECRTLVPGRAVLSVVGHFGYDEAGYREGASLFEALMADLTLPGHAPAEPRPGPTVPAGGRGTG